MMDDEQASIRDRLAIELVDLQERALILENAQIRAYKATVAAEEKRDAKDLELRKFLRKIVEGG